MQITYYQLAIINSSTEVFAGLMKYIKILYLSAEPCTRRFCGGLHRRRWSCHRDLHGAYEIHQDLQFIESALDVVFLVGGALAVRRTLHGLELHVFEAQVRVAHVGVWRDARHQHRGGKGLDGAAVLAAP
jgi:hypothetical protein